MKTLALILLLLFTLSVSAGLAQSAFRIDSLPPQGVLLNQGWKFHAGDNPDWAKADFDDAKWEYINPLLDVHDSLPQIPRPSGICWFRLHLTLSKNVLKSPLALRISQSGASEIYENGVLIKKLGRLSANPEEIKAFDPWLIPINMSGNKDTNVVLAVRYTLQPNVRYTTTLSRQNPALQIHLNDSERAFNQYANRAIRRSDSTTIRIGIFSIVFLLFISYYLYDSQQKANLYFSLYALLEVVFEITADTPTIVDKIYYAHSVGWSIQRISIFLLLTALYSLFNQKRAWVYWGLMGFTSLSIFLEVSSYHSGNVFNSVIVGNLINIEIVRITLKSIRIKKRGAWIIAAGGICFAVFWIAFLTSLPFAFNYWLTPFMSTIYTVGDVLYNVAILSIPIAVSIYLGLDTANTNRLLRQKLVEVETLSAEKQQILSAQNETLEKQVEARTAELKHKNRDLEIEGALEKIRSASLAIHHSNELEKVVVILFDKLNELGIPFDSTFIYFFEKPTRNIEAWVATKLLPAPIKVKMPYDESVANNPIITDLWYAIENGEHGLNKSYKEKDKDDYYRYEAKHNPSLIPESVTDFQLDAESWTTTFASEKNSIVGFDSWNGYLTTLEDFQTLKRFAKVFEQAYVRFLDLQKVEAQAREAQIETSFERIRASALAMQTSAEFLIVVKTLYQQINTLDRQELEATTIQFYDMEQGFINSWHAQNIDKLTADNISLGTTRIPFDACELTLEWINAYKATNEGYTIVAQGEKLKEWLRYLVKISPEIKDRLGDSLPEISNFHFCEFSEGALSMVSQKTFSEESKYLLKRAASAFDLAYKRYLDLQLKEEQALKLAQEKQRLEAALTQLRATQNQLIQSEKLASLGELTAGIAHEIQNPLNFVNNFSEVSVELLDELKTGPMQKIPDADKDYADEILGDLTGNLQKITQHGQRASNIVKGMLEHARASTGERQTTNLNALAEEYLRLAYHGLQAKKKDGSTGTPERLRFSCELVTDFALDLPLVSVVPQDIGRVLLNLFNNGFYAVQERAKAGVLGYSPTLWVNTVRMADGVSIRVRDNGTGMPEAVKAKIFQPFFTTKPTGDGTGLGMSLAYDIVTKGHGGTLMVESTEGEGTEFVIELPG